MIGSESYRIVGMNVSPMIGTVEFNDTTNISHESQVVAEPYYIVFTMTCIVIAFKIKNNL